MPECARREPQLVEFGTDRRAACLVREEALLRRSAAAEGTKPGGAKPEGGAKSEGAAASRLSVPVTR
jgi:hypothetical protein